jgi:hypothetical protein
MASSWPPRSPIQSFIEPWSRFWRGEYDRDTLRSVPSWGVSLLLHSLFLLLLALAIQLNRQGPQERTFEGAVVDTQLGGVTSLVEAIRSGDPFTKNDSPDPPSLGLEPVDSTIKLVGEPQIASLSQFAPVMASPLAAPNAGAAALSLSKARGTGPASVSGSVRLGIFSESISAPFAGRQGLTRAKLLRREGGTARSEKSVDDGLDWIVRHQRADGSWSLNFQDQCQQPQPCPFHFARSQSDTAATGLALLPLLGAGHIHTVKCKYQDSVRRGLEWLTSHQAADGDLFTGPPGMAYLYSHAIATMAICEAYGLSGDASLQPAAKLAIAFICNSQDPLGGGWRYSPGQAGDTSVFGWNIFALRSGHLAGIGVPQKVLKGCSRYLDQAATDRSRVTYLYQPGVPRGGNFLDPVMTTEALLSRQLLGWPRDFPALVKGVGMISAHLQEADERNIYYWYYATQLLHNMGGAKWERWNLKIREGLIGMQVKDGTCAQGSWDPSQPQPDRWAGHAGRLYLTSLSILTLEVYYRYLPIYRAFDEDQEKPAAAMKAPDGDKPKDVVTPETAEKPKDGAKPE